MEEKKGSPLRDTECGGCKRGVGGGTQATDESLFQPKKSLAKDLCHGSEAMNMKKVNPEIRLP
jgi:hypothetical protein